VLESFDMQHYVLTRSAYAPTVPEKVNRYRLKVFSEITAKSLAAQTNKDWTWAVMVHRDDPLVSKRKNIVRNMGVPFRFFYWNDEFLPNSPEFSAPVEWGDTYSKRIGTTGWNTIVTSGSLWRRVLPAGKVPLLMTRMDDDDALFPTTLERVRVAAEKSKGPDRITFTHPLGLCVFNNKYSLYWHPSNMLTSMMTWPPDLFTAFEGSHNDIHQFSKVEVVDEDVAWVYARHPEAITYVKEDARKAGVKLYKHTPVIYGERIDDDFRSLLPLDWSVLRRK